MKLSKTFIAAATVSLLSVTAASAVSVAQCEELGGTVDLATAQCLLTEAQVAEAESLGYLPAGGAAGVAGAAGAAGGAAGAAGGAAGAAGLGTVTVSAGAAAAAGLGLALTVAVIGDGGSDTSTATTTSF